jgi:MoaA/NifB/PqqE/SkfB family radical SAM enzyme
MRESIVKSTSSDHAYHCDEPWTGIFSIETNQDVTFCPCYLKMRIGNLDEKPMREIWNAPQLIELRKSFSEGVLPDVCQGQLCPVALGEQP